MNALKLEKLMDYQPGYIENQVNFRIGNGYFEDMLWDFNGFDDVRKNVAKARNQFDFSTIKHTQIALVFKQFLVTDMIANEVSTAKRDYDGLRYFYRFLESNYPSIDSLRHLTQMILRTYYLSVLEAKSQKTGGPLSRTSILHNTSHIKDLFLEGMRRGWDVPNEGYWIVPLYEVIIGESPRVAMPNKTTTKTAYSPETIATVIKCALKDSNIITKSAVIISTQIGVRIDEIVSIKAGCIKTISGKTKIEYIARKTKKGPTIVCKPVNALVIEVVKQLEKETEELRKQTGLEDLFISKCNRFGPMPCSIDNFNKNYLKPFVKRWDIKEDGKLIDLSSHYFRHFFAQGAWKNGMPVESISKMFDHDSLVMTSTYTYNLREQVHESFVDAMLSDQVIAGPAVGKIQERLRKSNPFKGKTESQIELIMDAMRIRTLSNGVCMHHPARGESCPVDGGNCHHCENFISMRCCLDTHKLRVERLKDEMKRAESHGNKIWYNKNREEKDYLENTFIKPLEEGGGIK